MCVFCVRSPRIGSDAERFVSEQQGCDGVVPSRSVAYGFCCWRLDATFAVTGKLAMNVIFGIQNRFVLFT